MKHASTIGLGLVVLSLCTAASPAERPLHKQSFKDIIDKYLFVGDFSQKEETRSLPTQEVFWRYPTPIPKIYFPYDLTENNPKQLAKEFPATQGVGRFIEHLNRGRQFYLEGNYPEARSTWLSARARFGKEAGFHRRNDYFLGYVFIHMGLNKTEGNKRIEFGNATTFLSSALQLKQDIHDPLLDEVAPKAYYNLAALYYNHQRYAAAFGAANEGLNFLRRTGRSDFRSQLRRILAEAYIQNRTYLQAVQELDTALRQDIDKTQAASIFARVGDIYFDLNNFELAEDAYALAGKVNKEINQIQPNQVVLQGESLFWMGQFSEAQKRFHYAVNSFSNPQRTVSELDTDFAALASIRTADAWLAQGDYGKLQDAIVALQAAAKRKDLAREDEIRYERALAHHKRIAEPFEKAKLGYYRHITEFRNHPTASHAQIRLACLELPNYDGKNVTHTREVLAQLKLEQTGKPDTPILPPEAIHLAWACETASYAQRERTEVMLDRVREFAKRYPESRFLNDLVNPVWEVQAAKIGPYFENGDLYGATQFFEKNRTTLYKKVPEDLKVKLFRAYATINLADKAAEFWAAGKAAAQDDTHFLQLAAVAAEVKQNNKTWTGRNRALAKDLTKRQWTTAYSEPHKLYVSRVIATPRAGIHAAWIFKLVRTWDDKEHVIGCQIIYPLLSKAFDEPRAYAMTRYEVTAASLKMLDEDLPSILRFQTFCGYSLMEFETKILAGKPDQLAKRMLSRTYLPIDPITANIYWTVAENLRAIKHTEGARAIWQLLADKGSNDIPEVKYARTRLDPSKTEFEKLWE